MRLFSTLAAALLVSTAALAQPAPDAPQPPPEGGGPPPMAAAPGTPHPSMRERFEGANTTHDGKLTREQAAAGGMPNIARHFDQIDTDRKGYITLQDLRAFAQARRAARAARLQGQTPTPPPPQ